MPFDLRTLEVFFAVCEVGSMAGAAKMLQITQPAVSQTIAELETALRCRLFDRDLRPIALTPAGLLVRQHARSLLADARQILPALQRSRQAKLPLLRIGMGPSLSRNFGSVLASSLKDEIGQISIFSGLSPVMTTELFSRDLDIVIAVDEYEHLEGVERIELFTEPYVAIVPRDYPGVDPQTVTDLLDDLPLIRFTGRSQSGADIDRQLRRLRVDAPRHFEFDEPHGLTELVALGIGWAVATPLQLLGAMPDMQGVRMIPFPGPAFGRTLSLLFRRRELGDVPSRVADSLSRFIGEDWIPQVTAETPWLAPHLKLMTPGQA